MVTRSSPIACLTASLLVAACGLHSNGLGSAGEESDDAGGLVGTPGVGGAMTGTGGSGVVADAGSISPPVDAPVVSLPPDAPVVAPPPPLPPDAAPMMPPPPPPADAAPVTPPPADAAPPRLDAPPMPPPAPNTISCGNGTCVAGLQACCVTATSSGCIPFAGVCVGGAIRRCDGPEDCDGGRVCCAQPQNTGTGTNFRTACSRPAECTQQGGVAVCKTTADCPPNRTCGPVSFPGGTISVCR